MLHQGQQIMLHLDGEPVTVSISRMTRLPGQSIHETTIFIKPIGDNKYFGEMRVPIANDFINSWKDRDLEAFIIKQGYRFQRVESGTR